MLCDVFIARVALVVILYSLLFLVKVKLFGF